MKRSSVFVILAAAMLLTALCIPAMAAEVPVAPDQVSTYANTEMKGDFGQEYPVVHYCPVCNAEKNWYPLDQPLSGMSDISSYHHYYLLKDIAHNTNGFYRVGTLNTSVCLYMNGFDLTNEAYIPLQISGGTLNLIANGTESLSGGGLNSSVYGAAIDIRGGSVNLFGVNVTKTPGTSRPGPAIGFNEASGTANIYAGTTVSNGVNSGNGGNIGLYYEGSVLNMYGGSVTGGRAAKGGNIAATAKDCQVNIYGGSITNGVATGGGNIITTNGAKLNIGTANGAKTVISGGQSGTGQGGNIACGGDTTIVNALISNGTATTAWGGNVYIDSYQLTIGKDTTIENGSASAGGNLTAYAAVLDIDDAVFIGGSANNSGTYKGGGSLYLWNTSVTIDNATFTGGNAGQTYGGVMYLRANKSVAITGSTITGGTASTGANIYNSGPATFTDCEITSASGYLYNSGALTFDGCTLGSTILSDSNITFKDTTADVITARQGQVTLAGNTRINNLDVFGNNTAYATMLVEDTFTGEVILYNLATKPDAVPYGKALDGKYTATGNFTGKLILNWVDAKPWVFNDNGSLVVGNARTVKDRVVTWHKDNAAAVQNYNGADHLIPGDRELSLARGNYVVNVAGLDLNVTGSGTVTFFDTANKDYTQYGTVKVGENVTVANEFATEVAADGDQTYYMIDVDGVLSFHRIGITVSGVSLRPGNAGIYYTGRWDCDALLSTKIKSFGIAVSVAGQPGADFREKQTALYTALDQAAFVSGKDSNSVLISDILKEGQDNDDRAATPIYATAYITLDDGTPGGLTLVDDDARSFSMKQMMQRIDADPRIYLTNKSVVDGFYKKWETLMETWNFENITGTAGDPAADDTLNVLMIGNSFSYYYVQELYDLLAQDGIKANIYNLYKSGCTMQEHYDWWMNNRNGYQFFWKTNEDGYNLVKGDATMAEALMAENWDVISIQESLFKNIASDSPEAYLTQNKLYRDTLIPMLKKAFPNAQIYWHQQWSPEVGFDKGSFGGIADAAAQAAYVQREYEAAVAICAQYGIKRVNTGDAWANFRNNEESVKLLPAGGLCARISENGFAGPNGGDGYHDGDIGGGQYLNACVWYEVLTGKDCRGKSFELKTYNNNKNTAAYAPYYELPAELVAALQNAAHEAVATLAD